MTIQYNSDQLKALDHIWNWWKTPERPFILQGYAGTGKSTLVHEALERLQIPDKDVALICPTAIAAKNLTNRSGRKATTIHKFLYSPADKEMKILKSSLKEAHEELENIEKGLESDYTLEQVELDIKRINNRLSELGREKAKFVKKFLLRKPSLIVADETSMISEYIGKDLEELEIPLIYIGDPFQLAPVQAKCIWEGRKANALLTKIERQGEGSGIVYAAQEVRLGGSPIDGPGFQTYGRGEFPLQSYLDADLVLAGTNVVRRDINSRIRAELGYNSQFPMINERVVCLKNDYEYEVANGELFTVKDVTFEGKYQIGYTLEDAFGVKIKVRCWKALFDDDSKGNMVPEGFVHLTFAYCLTVHKAQGSEGKKVVLLDSWPGRQWDRWTYTGITRAMQECHYISNIY